MEDLLKSQRNLLKYKVEGIDLLGGQLESQSVMNRYRIESYVDQGKFGRIFNITDFTKKRPQKPLVMKIVDYSE